MIPPAILPRLAKLLPLLASDQDGEVIATARAIGRTLASAGSDFHALAAALEPQPLDWSAFINEAMARTKREPAAAPAEPVEPDAPDAPSTRWGLPIWGVKKIEPWCVVAQHCLSLDWTIPKAAGGKFLTKEERATLKTFEKYRRPTNAEADWIESVVARCHAARDKWRTPKTENAA